VDPELYKSLFQILIEALVMELVLVVPPVQIILAHDFLCPKLILWLIINRDFHEDIRALRHFTKLQRAYDDFKLHFLCMEVFNIVYFRSKPILSNMLRS